MKHQHYGTMEVIRQCAVPGTMVTGTEQSR